MTIPAGVTVHQSRPVKSTEPRNVFDLASQMDDVDLAIALVKTVLNIKTDRLARVHLSEQRRWKQMPAWSRLQEIGAWVKAECYELMDLVSSPAPISTVGTND